MKAKCIGRIWGVLTTAASPAAHRPRRMPSHAPGLDPGTASMRTEDLTVAYSFLELAYEVLEDSDGTLTYQKVSDAASNAGLTAKLKTSGKTPWARLGSRRYVDIGENQVARFVGLRGRAQPTYSPPNLPKTSPATRSAR